MGWLRTGGMVTAFLFTACSSVAAPPAQTSPTPTATPTSAQVAAALNQWIGVWNTAVAPSDGPLDLERVIGSFEDVRTLAASTDKPFAQTLTNVIRDVSTASDALKVTLRSDPKNAALVRDQRVKANAVARELKLLKTTYIDIPEARGPTIPAAAVMELLPEGVETTGATTLPT